MVLDDGADVELDDGADVDGRAATLHTLRSNRASTLGSAFDPKFHLPLTNSGIGQSGICVLH